jgi:hypothetical protein
MVRGLADAPAPVHERSFRDAARTAALLLAVAIGVAARWWRLGARLYQYDEAFTAVAARRPLGGLVPFLRDNDSHPPLDYLIRAPFAHGGYDLFALRAPSAVFSTCALVLFAWWMRRRGWFGVLATFVMATNGFQLLFGREARMYALLELLGVIAAMVLAAWLEHPRRLHAVIIGVVVFVGAMDHASMLFFAMGFLVAAGTRRDRPAWEWRAGVIGGLAAWSALWGASFVAQARGDHAGWIPPTSLDRIAIAGGRLVSLRSGPEIVAFVVLGFGLFCLVRTQTDLARLAAVAFVLPSALVALCGIFVPILIERTLTLGAWAPCLAIAAIPAFAAKHGSRFAAAVVVVVVVITVPSGIDVLTAKWPDDDVARALRSVAGPGDVVAIDPGGWAALTDYGVAAALGGAQPVEIDGLAPNTAFLVGDAQPTGRIWLATQSHRSSIEGDACARSWRVGEFRIQCVRVAVMNASS